MGDTKAAKERVTIRYGPYGLRGKGRHRTGKLLRLLDNLIREQVKADLQPTGEYSSLRISYKGRMLYWGNIMDLKEGIEGTDPMCDYILGKIFGEL